MKFKRLNILVEKALHPIGFAIFPVLSLFSHNFDAQTLDSLILPFIISLIVGLVIWILIKLFVRSWEISALITSIILLLVFSYGHLFSILNDYISESSFGSGYLMVLGMIMFFIHSMLLKKNKTTIKKFTTLFNIVAITLIIMPISLIGYRQTLRMVKNLTAIEKIAFENEDLTTTNQPDIYYIIVERYGSQDVLKESYDFDNSEFIKFLEGQGFYIAKSQANYHFTITSLASSLNMDYLTDLEKKMGTEETDQYPLAEHLENNTVIDYMKSRGYQYLHFGYEQGGLTTQNPHADFNYNLNKRAPLNVSKFFGILISQTIYDPLVSLINRVAKYDLIPDTAEGRRKRYYDLTLDQFKQLGNSAKIPGPKFVFAHTFIPHDPHVFEADGSYMNQKTAQSLSYKQSYINQIIATNKILKDLIEALQKDSRVQPVIIIQADEGPYPEKIWKSDTQTFKWMKATKDEFKEKFGILNAYYLPGKTTTGLYPAITPVNSFRLVFNLYFGENLPFLPDKIYANVDKMHIYNSFEITKIFR